MLALWTIVRFVLLLASLATILFGSSASTSLDTVAVVVFVFMAWSLWRDRRALV